MLIWFGVGTGLILLELLTPTFIFLFFGLGAWGAALTAYLYPGLTQEFATFIIIASISLFLFRTKMKEIFQGMQAGHKNTVSNQSFSYIGKEAVVHKEVSPQREGEVVVGGSYWRAKSEVLIPRDAVVIIEKQDAEDNQLLIVKPQQ